jgi:hypothetical protein
MGSRLISWHKLIVNRAPARGGSLDKQQRT